MILALLCIAQFLLAWTTRSSMWPCPRSPAALLVARAVQGFAAAMLQPAILGLIGARFPAGAARTRALSVWGAVGASGLAVGVLAGGLLTQYQWRWVFLINVPVGLVCAVGAAIWLLSVRPHREPPSAGLRGTLLASGAVLLIVLGLTFGGWGIAVSTTIAVAASLTAKTKPSMSRVAAALYMASVGSEFYVVTLMLQHRDAYTPLEAGLAFLPLAAMVTLGSALTARLVRRFATAPTLAGGFILAVAALAWLALDGALLPGLIVSGLAHGVIYTSMFGLSDGTPSDGAAMTTAQYLSGAVAIAILTLPLQHAAYGTAFWLTAAAAAAGALVALRPRVA